MDRTYGVWTSVLFGFFACVFVLIATSRYGIGLSADSVTYIAGAENIAGGRGYANFDGEPILAFPPLFSTLIAVLSLDTFDLTNIARYVNALCFGLVVFLIASWLFRNLRSSLLALLGTTAVIFSATLLGISVYAWSEPLFIVLTMLMLFQLEKVDSSDSPAPWVLAGIFASLAVLSRYAGIIVVVTGLILLATKRAPDIASWSRRLIVFMSIAMLPICLWFYRNYQLSSTITGYRVESERTFIQAGSGVAKVLSLWFLPGTIPFLYRLFLIGLLIVLFLLIVFVVLRIKITIAEIKQVIPLVLFIVIYTMFMIYTTSSTALSEIDNRYMSPIFPPFLLSLFYLLDRLLHNYSTETKSKFPRLLLATIVALGLIFPTIKTYRNLAQYLSEGAGGFHTAYWAESELMSYLSTSELSGSVYTNEPSAVYALTGQSFLQSPEKFAYESKIPTEDMIGLQSDLQDQGVLYIVWFHTDWWQGWLYDIDELNHVCELEKIVGFEDGEVYRMSFPRCGEPT